MTDESSPAERGEPMPEFLPREIAAKRGLPVFAAEPVKLSDIPPKSNETRVRHVTHDAPNASLADVAPLTRRQILDLAQANARRAARERRDGSQA